MQYRAFPKFAFLVGLVAFGLFGLRCEPADPVPATVSESTNEVLGSGPECGYLAWAVLDAIEREHISPPSRRELVQIFTRALIEPRERSRDPLDLEFLERLDADFLQCQSPLEMAYRIERLDCPLVSFEVFIEKFTEGLGKRLGEVRLIRAKDHDVEEQFRGNRYIGIGVTVRTDETLQLPVVVKIIDGGPAERGGLKLSTIITEINGRSTRNASIEQVIDWIRGPQGTDVTLRVFPKDSEVEQFVTLTRGVIRFASLKSDFRIVESELIGWIRAADITASTLHELRSAESQWRSQGIRAFVFDFRQSGRSDNFHQALLIADAFLDDGPIWARTDRSGKRVTEVADREMLFRGVPIVILINEKTGPAHCAVAAALQDAGRATIVGDISTFRGLIPSTLGLVGVPYSLVINTAKLTRSRRSRVWPLTPDVLYTEDAMTRMDFDVTSKRSLESMNDEYKAFFKLKVGRDLKADFRSLVSPLNRANGPLWRGIPRPMPLVKRESADDVALRIARKLLNDLPSEQDQ